MSAAGLVSDDQVDDHVDLEIAACLDFSGLRSFFLFAGAGSGKTRSLVNALLHVRAKYGDQLRLRGQQIAVITYTNAACDEIIRRISFDPLISVSTIHSFVWGLIGGFNDDIRSWLKDSLTEEIAKLSEEQAKGRAGTQKALDRQASIMAKQQRCDSLPGIKKFIYSPTGDNRTRDSLSHAEVIKITASFLEQKPLLRMLLVSRFPVMLIDESQDTNKLLMEAFIAVQSQHRDRFCLGLFGDTMQRIYFDGKVDVDRGLPADWAKPAKVMNHRCPQRLVRLLNQIRGQVDRQQQRARSDAKTGTIRLFVFQDHRADKAVVETRTRARMATITGDASWTDPVGVKTLILEHRMAAIRLGFLPMFEALDKVDSFKTGLRDGSLPHLRFFTELVLPLVSAQQQGNDFAVTAIVREASPLLRKKALVGAGVDQLQKIRAAKDGVDQLSALFGDARDPLLIEVLQSVAASGLFEIPGGLWPFAGQAAGSPAAPSEPAEPADTEVGESKTLELVRQFLSGPFSQVTAYRAYIRGDAAFATHQGVKGLEFSRVLVLMDDEAAGGFSFSFEKLFGVHPKTPTDIKNEREGIETGIERTRRLFYVTASRARESLGLLAYTDDAAKVRENALAEGLFEEGEIELL